MTEPRHRAPDVTANQLDRRSSEDVHDAHVAADTDGIETRPHQWAALAGFAAITTGRVDVPAAAAMVPYLAWTAFAGALNLEIVRRND